MNGFRLPADSHQSASQLLCVYSVIDGGTVVDIHTHFLGLSIMCFQNARKESSLPLQGHNLKGTILPKKASMTLRSTNYIIHLYSG